LSILVFPVIVTQPTFDTYISFIHHWNCVICVTAAIINSTFMLLSVCLIPVCIRISLLSFLAYICHGPELCYHPHSCWVFKWHGPFCL
jgi:hypothetical protein